MLLAPLCSHQAALEQENPLIRLSEFFRPPLNKRLGAALALVKQQQATYAPNRRRHDPARGRPPNNLEAPGMPTKNRTREGEIDASSA